MVKQAGLSKKGIHTILYVNTVMMVNIPTRSSFESK
jgi:hypothetical protein